jgi:uncharacterized protein YbjT (DUF2867 family)
MRVAVTGATGFTGRRVVSSLLSRGHEVTALVRAPPARGALPPTVATVEGDIGDPDALARLLDGAHALVHVASLAFGLGERVVAALHACGPRRALFFSSTAIFTSLPADSKAVRLAAEQSIRQLPGAWTILRPTMIYGDEGDRNLSRLIRFVARSPVVPLPGGGRALVQPVHVDDLGHAAADALTCAAAEGREYNLAGADAVPLHELVRSVARLLGRRVWIVPVPVQMTAAAIAWWRTLHLPPRISPEQVLRLAEDKAFSFDPARLDWGFNPRSVREGLAQEVSRLRERGLA